MRCPLPDVEVARVVSLVPSLTEAIAVTRQDALVGATDWCTHPQDLDVTRVRGTKNPDLTRIVDLEPQLVVVNKEENRELDVRRLREARIPVWVTVIEDVPQALESLTRLFGTALAWGDPPWLTEVRRLWSTPAPEATARVAVPIWRDPWMVVGSATFTGDLLARAGLANAFGDHSQRYPRLDLAELDRDDLDAVLLPDEPYVFSASDGPEAFHVAPTRLVSGRLITWYGPSLLEAREALYTVAAELGGG
ncbi:cobalamin-binding protein [Nostocoides sp. F2B08]|uniref:helical backbone metal receptor n=1 Tax=Nostocoides sp. F2B08 TaxID=2653936 RepID=UPI001262C6F2|nr:helical backbone metal receptor [Tetrasphaera sp. F2B08]KAB7746389.1 cobalamin-binding protein [Tetrasphaera sp. F2B08]